MTGIIIAGGKGTRLLSLTKGAIPKPMYKINGKTIIERQIEQMKKNGITDIIITVGELKNVIMDYLQHGEQFGVNITYIEEGSPLGTAGALYYLRNLKKDDLYLITMGDLIFDVDIKKAAEYHKQHNAYITLFVHKNNHPWDSDTILCDSEGKVEKIQFKSEEKRKNSEFVNSGIILACSDIYKHITKPVKVNLEKDIIAPICNTERIYAYQTEEFIKDAGTPERIAEIERMIL